MANAGLLGGMLPLGNEEAHEELSDLSNAAERGKAMIKRLMGLSRAEALELVPLDVAETVERTAKLLHRILPARVVVETDITPNLPMIVADAGAVEQMLMNLGTNARDAMPKGGVLTLAVRPADTPRYVAVCATDTGIGMDEATVRKVFEPFFTTKPAGSGTGLGLAMVQNLMMQHGGSADVTSALGKGTTVRLTFPAAPATARATRSSGPHRAARAAAGTGHVLVVDDEEPLRRAAKRILERHGYKVSVAYDGLSALAILRDQAARSDLVFSDLVMPRTSGAALYETVRREIGPVRLLFASGYSAAEASGREGLPPNEPFIRKPWTMEELVASVSDALAATAPPG
jgi:CheY-like chemotaxis protein